MFLICLILTYLLFNSLYEFGDPNASTALAYLGIFLLATIIICVKQKRFPARAIPSGLACLTLCLSFVLHNDMDLHMILFLLLIPLSGIYCVTLTNANVHSFGSFYVLLDLLHCELLIPLRHLFAPFTDGVARYKEKRAVRQTAQKNRKWLPVVIGLIIAIPLLLLVIPLMIDADAAFESVIGGLYQHITDALSAFVGWLQKVLPFNWFALVLSLLFTPYIYAVIHAFANGTAKNENKDTSSKFCKLQKLPVALIATVLGAVSVVYLIYLLTQAGYLFSAFSGHLPFGVSITVTEYARRGFFELCKLAGINFVLLALSVGVSVRKNGRISPLVKGFDIFLCLFTMLLCAVSVAKILLYIHSFGLTEKRLYVFAADIVLFVVFLAILLRLRFERFPYMKVMLCALFLVTAALGVLGVGNTIAWYNTNGLLSGRLENMTVNEIYNESCFAALPYVQKIAEGNSTYVKDAKQTLKEILFYGTPYNETEEQEASFCNLEFSRYQRFVAKSRKAATSFQVIVNFVDTPPVYAIGYAWRLNGKDVLSGGMEHADHSALGNDATLDFNRNDLPENTDLSALEVLFTLYLEPDDMTKQVFEVSEAEYSLHPSFEFGRLYNVAIRENGNGGFEADW